MDKSFFYEYLSQYSLILPSNIEDLADKGLNEPFSPFRLHASEGGWYIDNDRVGIMKYRGNFTNHVNDVHYPFLL